MQWYVVRTHVNKEFFASQNLIKQNIITYYPKYKKIKIHARKRSIIIKALFPRYIDQSINVQNCFFFQLRSLMKYLSDSHVYIFKYSTYQLFFKQVVDRTRNSIHEQPNIRFLFLSQQVVVLDKFVVTIPLQTFSKCKFS